MGIFASRHNQIERETTKKFPHYKTYAQCQSRAFFDGMAYLVGGAAAIGGLQELTKSVLPYGRNAFLFAPVLGGSVLGYVMTRRNTKMCQEMWLAMEDKHSFLKELDGQAPIPSTDSPQGEDSPLDTER